MDESHFTGTRIGIAGLGLIGGSLGMAFKRIPGVHVAGYDRDPETAAAAAAGGAADEASVSPQAALDSDILFVALYPADIIRFVTENAGHIRRGAVVIDCCGVKGMIMDALLPVARANGFAFIGGHPMAGTERSGFAAARPDLFDRASFLLTPPDGVPAPALERIRALLTAAGFARTVVTTPAHHDRMIAFTSQLPHVLACAYVSSPCCPEHPGYSAGSYRDVSRVAHINPSMWAELFIGNRGALCSEIDELIRNISALRDAVDAGDAQRIAGLLERACRIKDRVDHAV